VTRWIERLLGAHELPLTVAHYLALRSIARERVSGSELALRAGSPVPLSPGCSPRSPTASSSHAHRRRHALALTAAGERVYRSAEALLIERLRALLGDLSPPEADALARLLLQVEAMLAGTPPPRRPPPPPPPRTRATPATAPLDVDPEGD
jgi:hypothetical protein